MRTVTENAVTHAQYLLDEQIADRDKAKAAYDNGGPERDYIAYDKFDDRVTYIIRTALILGIELETK